MTCTRFARLAGALLVFATLPSLAQGISADDFAKRPEGWGATMSPNGEFAALEIPTADGTETQLQILRLDGSGRTQVLRFGKMEHVSDVQWTTDDRVVLAQAQTNAFRTRPYTRGELFSSAIDGSAPRFLFGYGTIYRDHGWAQLMDVLEDEPGMALVDFTCWNCGEEPDTVVYKVDTRTGKRSETERVKGTAGLSFDRTGEARVRTTLDANDEPILAYRPTKGSAWQPMPKAIAGRRMHNLVFEADNNVAYAFISDGFEPAQAYRVDFAAGTRTKLAGKPDVEAAYFLREGRGGTPFAVVFIADKPSVQYLKPESEWTKLHLGLLKSFPGMMVHFRDASRNGNRVLFSTWSDRDEGAWYLYDRTTKKAQKLLDYRPWLQTAKLAPVKPVTIPARDGTPLFGLYTAQKGDGPKPLVVIPHGGPFGVADTWEFHRDAQFLASRGYAVLQVNYRGSDGRGEGFERAGWKEWGGRIQDDIADGVKWAIAQNLADKDRVCIYGASFGGYSALMQPILNPGLYKCAVGYVGVYDLPLMRKTDKRDGEAKRTARFWDRTLGTDLDALAKVSPLQRAKDIGVPVFLVHGEDDKTADFNQFKAMSAALRATGHPAEELVVDNEGHGFAKPENIAELYRRLEAFLDKHIGSGATTAATQ